MPVTTPVQLGLPNYRQSRTEINPMYFTVGTDLYVVQIADQHGVNAIGVFKRAASNVGGAWILMDSAGSPDQGSQQGRLNAVYDSGTGIIAILYVLTTPSHIKIVEFDTATDTYAAPTAFFATTGNNNRMGFWRQSGGDYVVLSTDGFVIFYVVNSGGVWGSQNTVLTVNATLYGGEVDASDTFHFIYSTSATDLIYRNLDVAFSVSGPTTISSARDVLALRPNLVLNGTHVDIGFIETTGTGEAHVQIGTPLAAPVFTDYVIDTGTATLKLSYATPAVSLASASNFFYVAIDYTTGTIIDEMRQSTFDGVSTWSAPAVFYDETANPPADGDPNPLAQFIHAIQAIELSTGWTAVTALETTVTAVNYCTGFFLEPSSGTPTRTLYTWPPILLGSPTPPPGTFAAHCPSPIYVVGTPYDSFVTVTGGTGPYTFAVTAGSLPTGLSLNASTGEITGTPSATGPFSFTITVTDSTGATASTGSCSAGRCPGTRSII